ncbi:hypothetical protein NFI96_012701 [Prochilodus magdalenae]|nr:hypothetical protein NFI96_012701 [Prochilodus magdalenae]
MQSGELETLTRACPSQCSMVRDRKHPLLDWWPFQGVSCPLVNAFVGGVIGLLFAYICYRQHYPPFLHTDCHLPYASLAQSAAQHAPVIQEQPQPTDNATSLPLEGMTEGPV